MPDLLFDRERTALAELWKLIESRRQGEEELTVSSAEAQETAVDEGETAAQGLAARHERELAELDSAFQKEQEALSTRHAAEEAAAQRALVENRQRLEAAEKETLTRLQEELKDALWTIDSVSEGGQKRVQEQLQTVKHKVAVSGERIEALWKEVDLLLARVDLEREDIEPEGKVAKPKEETLREFEALLTRADELVQTMRHLPVLPWLRWTVTIFIAVVAGAVGTVPALWLKPQHWWLLGGIMVGFLVALVSRNIFYALARRRLRALARKFAVLLAQAHGLGGELAAQTEAWAAVQQADLRNKHTVDRRKAENRYRPQLEELALRTRTERDILEQQFQTNSRARRHQLRQAQETSRQRYQESRAGIVARQQKERRDTETAHADRLRNVEQTQLRKTQQLRQRWQTGAARLLATFNDLQQAGAGSLLGNGEGPEDRRDKPGGSQTAALVGAISAGLPFGTVTVDVPRLAGEMPAEKLAPLPLQPLPVPAFLPFPRLGGLLLQAYSQGRVVAIQALQALMLRFLTSLPAGKVRFTIFDPVGLGDNFAAFMHLADHDEALVTSRIWTEPGHIEKQLSDLTAHMENVIQKYLRSQFSSIEDYNAAAGEVAEPYRVLVVANFPVNFTPQAARRLVSIVQSGASCGVYVLIGLDMRQALPQGFQLDDLEQLCLNLYWKEDRFLWGDPDLDRYPLTLETPPDGNRVIETVRRIGALSKDANRVQVPFSFIAPAPDLVWKGDSRKGINVPLGRAGAVRTLALSLGQGTSQHVLVAGKTGSGKSTLLHALISNLVLHYSPDEVELYLIDFKKGVEFKLYAEQQLPHARVIAIESEREFGLSVLQRLDGELRRRGDLFRASSTNDVASYRQAHPEERLPRIMLIVDEFQEFFTEDDKLSQEAALLLDRLVRQGRAFGLHVLLGSQTLGGAYSLARSTIDQMAVRIALQCSESDAQLILNKDNSAARLLSRPGEAIYNDTNGTIEGNEVFQIVWLPEAQREEVMQTVRRRAEEELPEAAARLPLVFEGNTPAELDRNPLLLRVLEERRDQPEGSPVPRGGARAWLGDAIAIKDPTAALFRPQTGSNLLIVGQNDESAVALLAASLVGLALQQPSARFLVLDGTATHEPNADFLKAVMEGWQQPMERVERAGLTPALAGLAEEMNQRLKGTSTDRSVRYLLINGLQRYREFRKSDDDMGFGRRGADRVISPLEHLQALLRDGPVVGIHVLIWCDTLVNVMRSLDRPGLRECAQRVLFQMSAADSSILLDSPLASRLGRNRALYSTDEMAQAEKFRPYGLLSLTWLGEVKERLGVQAGRAH